MRLLIQVKGYLSSISQFSFTPKIIKSTHNTCRYHLSHPFSRQTICCYSRGDLHPSYWVHQGPKINPNSTILKIHFMKKKMTCLHSYVNNSCFLLMSMGSLPSLNANYTNAKYQESLEQKLWVVIFLASPLYSQEFLYFSSFFFFFCWLSFLSGMFGKQKEKQFCSKPYYCTLASLWLTNMFILALCCSFQKQNSAK